MRDDLLLGLSAGRINRVPAGAMLDMPCSCPGAANLARQYLEIERLYAAVPRPLETRREAYVKGGN